MKCAIQLVFDDETQAKLNNLRSILNKNGVNDEAVPINHISLADIEINNNQINEVREILQTFAQTHNQIKLVLCSVGSFMSKENVLFLTPVITEDLINYNDELISTLTKMKIPCGKYYTKNNWQPHCTIAIRISDEQLFKGFEVLKNNNILPLQVTANKIDLLRYDPKPYEELISFNLKK